MTAFTFQGATLVADVSGALFWPAERVLVISDWHLAKGQALAARGGHLLPPYDDRENLGRFEALAAAYAPATVISLGDSFDHPAHGLGPSELARLERLMERRSWVWVLGNHDPTLPHDLPGLRVDEHRLGALTFRHEAERKTAPGEVSGHYHPKAAVRIRGRRIRSKCFAVTEDRLILPAFGTYTGGLDITDPAYAPYLKGPMQILMCHQDTVHRLDSTRLEA